MTLTVHVGAHKTASTHLQQSLRAALPQMAAAGIHYSDASHWRAGPLPLSGSLDDGPQSDRMRRWLRARMDMIDQIWPEQILSEENILGTLRPQNLMGKKNLVYPHAKQRVNRLCGAFRRRPMTICLSVRDPLGFLNSAFSMRVMGGRALVWQDFLGGFDPAALSWTWLARRLLGVRGVTRLLVWRYEDYQAVRPALLARLLPAHVAADIPDPARAVVGLSQAAYDLIQRRAMTDIDGDLTDIARDAQELLPRGPDHPPLRMGGDALAAACARSYAADLDRLASLPRVELLQP